MLDPWFLGSGDINGFFSKEYQVIFCDLVPRVFRFTTSHMPWIKHLKCYKLLKKSPCPSHNEWELRDRDIYVKTQHRRTVIVGERVRLSENPVIPRKSPHNTRFCLQAGCGWFHTEIRFPLWSKLTSTE